MFRIKHWIIDQHTSSSNCFAWHYDAEKSLTKNFPVFSGIPPNQCDDDVSLSSQLEILCKANVGQQDVVDKTFYYHLRPPDRMETD